MEMKTNMLFTRKMLQAKSHIQMLWAVFEQKDAQRSSGESIFNSEQEKENFSSTLTRTDET